MTIIIRARKAISTGSWKWRKAPTILTPYYPQRHTTHRRSTCAPSVRYESSKILWPRGCPGRGGRAASSRRRSSEDQGKPLAHRIAVKREAESFPDSMVSAVPPETARVILPHEHRLIPWAGTLVSPSLTNCENTQAHRSASIKYPPRMCSCSPHR